MLVIVGGLLALGLLGVAALRLPVFGGRPDAADRARFAASANYDSESRTFANRVPERIAEMRANSMSLEVLREWFGTRADGRPSEPLPEVAPDLDAFLAPGDAPRLIWLGHSTFLLNIGGTVVLVDPVLSDAASPVPFTVRRFQPPVLRVADLPPVDVVLISHDHYDHLDRASVRALASGEAEFVVPLGVGAHLERWGVPSVRIVERDWWEDHETHGITFTAAPAQHFSGRAGIDNDRTLWASWIIVGAGSRLYYSGDSGYDTHFAEIGRRFGPFDLAVLENGQYDPSWRSVHLLPEDTVRAFEELGAERLLPVHWGMFELAFHTWYAPAVAIEALAGERGIELLTPRIGELVAIGDGGARDRWWEPRLP